MTTGEDVPPATAEAGGATPLTWRAAAVCTAEGDSDATESLDHAEAAPAGAERASPMVVE